MSEIQEHTIVFATEDIGSEVPKGAKGAIVHIYNPKTYEVEFVVDGCSYVKTVTRGQIISL